MEKKYICPKCRADLKVENHIILTARTDKNKRGLVLVSPELGDYTSIYHKDTMFNEGDVLKIFCPVCFDRLGVDEIDEHLAKITMIDEVGVESDLYFSKVIGERCTYQVVEEQIIEKFGDHVANYSFFDTGTSFDY